jgi:hypothetical protein
VQNIHLFLTEFFCLTSLINIINSVQKKNAALAKEHDKLKLLHAWKTEQAATLERILKGHW